MKKFLVYLLLFCCLQQATAQSTDSTSNSIKVFLNCSNYCYQDYLRTQITWVNFVQDQFVAEVDLLVASINTGSGGSDFTLYFKGRKQFNGMTDTLHFVTNAINTDAEVRELMSQKVKLGLVRFAAQAGFGDQLLITSTNVQDIDDIGSGGNPEEDPFNAWVFRVSGNANMDVQKVSQSGDFFGSITATQVKEEFKLRLSLNANYSEQRYNYNGEKGTFTLRSQNVSGFYVHSLNPRWSLGAFTNIQVSDFSNYDYWQRVNVALEYDFFPYKEAQTKLLTLGYFVGATYYDFQDTTIYNQLVQLVPSHSINLGSSFTQTWGSLSGGVYASAFIDDFEKRALGGWLNFDVRIFKGFSINSYLNFGIPRDQINIRKSGATSDEVLLQQQELQSNFNFNSYIGLGYRFGSIYNNVVNPRFDYSN